MMLQRDGADVQVRLQDSERVKVGIGALLLFNDDVRLKIRWIFHQKGSV